MSEAVAPFTDSNASRRPRPTRGDVLPLVGGVSPAGEPVSLRDYYMRRNMAVVVVGDDETGRNWLARSVRQIDAAASEAGVIVAIAPSGVETHGLVTIVGDDGRAQARLGLEPTDLPALFLIDRFGTLFATNVGKTGTPDIGPDDIPGWLEFIACRCT